MGSAQESERVGILGGFCESPSTDVRAWKTRSSSGTPIGGFARKLMKGLGNSRYLACEHRQVSY